MVGYEIYLCDPRRGDDLWEAVMAAGKPHGIRAIAPSEARRIEAGIFNYGSDIRLENNPYEVLTPGGSVTGRTANIPFIDPNKKTPLS